MTTFFTADTHFGHRNIIDFCNRPWPNVDAMNDGLVERWNAVVDVNDVVYHLGDVALGNLNSSLLHVRRLNGYKILIPGNHDACWPHHRRVRPQDTARYARAFQEIWPSTSVITLGDQRAVVSHLPYEADERHGGRFAGLHPTDSGLWLIHGHVHGLWKVRGRQINVGVDVWDYTPVSEDALLDLMCAPTLTRRHDPLDDPREDPW